MSGQSVVDVRIPRADVAVAMQLLVDAELYCEILVDPYPPAAGPEAEVSVLGGFKMDYIEQLLRQGGVTPLAIRTRMWRRSS